MRPVRGAVCAKYTVILRLSEALTRQLRSRGGELRGAFHQWVRRS
jgi:hypothetical protein